MIKMILKIQYPLIFFFASIFLVGCSEDPPIEIEDEPQEISIISFNIRYDNENDGVNKWENRKEACINMLQQQKPSVFGLQEVLQDQLAYLNQNLTQYEYVGVGREDGANSGEHCPVFYLKDQFELIEENTFWLSDTPEVPSIGWDAALERIVTWVQLQDKMTKKSVFIFNTHFDHIGVNARVNSSLLLVQKIKEIASENSAVFITGDFNALSNNPLFIPISEEFLNAKEQASETDNINSFNSWGMGLAVNIDFIFYRNAEAISYTTIDENYGVPYISDHFPIMANFVF